MKELSIEEKAKRYDEAIERAKEVYQRGYYISGDIESIFPELKESEDEQHRKWILECLYDGLRKSDEQFKGQFKSAIAWLEKQGEQKVANKVEPKFHEGDWVIDKQGIAHQIANVVENVTNHAYGYDIVGGGYFNDNTEGVRLWNISDAKNNDILVSYNNLPFIFDGTFDEYCIGAHGGINVAKYFKTCVSKGSWTNPKGVKPATKEQQDLLFSKMKEAGYKLDKDFNLIKI